MSIPAAIYARVSSDRQREQATIASQTAALHAYAAAHDYTVPAAWVCEDDGYSVRPYWTPTRATPPNIAPDAM